MANKNFSKKKILIIGIIVFFVIAGTIGCSSTKLFDTNDYEDATVQFLAAIDASKEHFAYFRATGYYSADSNNIVSNGNYLGFSTVDNQSKIFSFCDKIKNKSFNIEFSNSKDRFENSEYRIFETKETDAQEVTLHRLVEMLSRY